MQRASEWRPTAGLATRERENAPVSETKGGGGGRGLRGSWEEDKGGIGVWARRTHPTVVLLLRLLQGVQRAGAQSATAAVLLI